MERTHQTVFAHLFTPDGQHMGLKGAVNDLYVHQEAVVTWIQERYHLTAEQAEAVLEMAFATKELNVEAF